MVYAKIFQKDKSMDFTPLVWYHYITQIVHEYDQNVHARVLLKVLIKER